MTRHKHTMITWQGPRWRCMPKNKNRKSASFGKMLLALRRVYGVSQKELAQILGVSRRAIAYYEAGEGLPGVEPASTLHARSASVPTRNLRHLKDAGVPLALGSDTMPGAGALAEIQFLKDVDVFSNLELLTMWSQTTPKVIFPKRKSERWKKAMRQISWFSQEIRFKTSAA